ncbi:MAG TPA: O-antigen ligase family protein [Ramlibacter sp.]|nr:O-antigen ligase family protein [Ramlibacter sp.]
MARKNRKPAAVAGATAAADASVPAAPAAAVPVTATRLPPEAGTGIVALILALMMFLAPVLGVPHEEMLQDTLKSIIVSFAALAAGILLFWQERDRTEPLRWHAVMWLPLLLMAYAIGSIAWSHAYLASVETIRWFVFALLVWLGANTLSRERLPWLAAGIHFGGVVASLWAALQFWADISWFPQGPHPASTFVNRNFFAEFAVCTLPFGAVLLARARQSAQIALLAASSALVIVAILMTGTRAALVALWMQLVMVLPFLAWLFREQFEFPRWSRGLQILALGVLVATVAVLGMIPAGDAKIIEEGRGTTALERGFKRTGSISVDDHSLGIRMIMWRATLRVIEGRPLSGVGAGAWENDVPLYQEPGSQLETDYYVHNEFLQLIAEYGVVGWLFLAGLLAFLYAAAKRTLLAKSREERAEGAWRAVFLCSLLAFMVVSSIGFPWRMAATGALFALCLGALAASDARLGVAGRLLATSVTWKPFYSHASAALLAIGIGLAIHITNEAARSEHDIVRATRIALTLSATGTPNDPRYSRERTEMLRLISEGVAINPHYRKITPMVADEVARWGDWKNAVWIWESVLESRPHIVAIITNVARGYTVMGNYPQAMEFLERAKKIQPRAPAVRSLEVILLARMGQEPRALELARSAIADNVYDYDMVNTGFSLAWRAGDYGLAERALQLRMRAWPATRPLGLVQLGNMYATSVKDPDRALMLFRRGRGLVSEADWQKLVHLVPPEYRTKLETKPATPPAGPQTSASKG